MRRPTRSRLGSRGFLSAGTALVLVVSSLAMVVGTGFEFGETKLRDGVTWVFDRKKGEAVRVNGSSGKVDMRIAMPGSKGKDLEIVQRNLDAMVVDKVSGQVASLDIDDLKVSKRVDFGDGKTIDAVMGDGSGFITNKADGSVQRVDPTTMELLGEPLAAGKGLTDGVSDAAGRLWVARNATGEIIRIDPSEGDGLEEGVRRELAGKGAQLEITVTDDGITVTDAKTGKQWRLDSNGEEIGSYLAVVPSDPPPPEQRYTPEASTGPYVPITSYQDDVPAVAPPPVQPGGGGDPVEPVPMENPGGPKGGYDAADPAVTLGDRIYVPVPDESVLLVLDRDGVYLETIPVPGEGGFQLILDDGRLWVNDPDDPEVLRIDEDGTVTTVEKSAEDVPITPPKEQPKPPKEDPKPPKEEPKPPTEGGLIPGTTTTTTTTIPAPTSTTLPAPPPTAPPTTSAPPPTAPPTTVKNPDPPGPVKNLAAAAGDATVNLTWLPGDTGGGRMIESVVRWQPAAGCGQAGQRKVAPNAVNATIGELADECTYTFTVIPENREAGKGKPASVKATPTSDQIPALAAAPQVATNHGDASTTVQWAAATDTKGQALDSYLVIATDGQGQRVEFPVPAGQTNLVAPATAGGQPGTLILGRTYSFSVGVVTGKGFKSPQSPESAKTWVYAGAAGIRIVNQQRQSAQVWVVTVQANWQGRQGTISAAGATPKSNLGADGQQTFEVSVPWGQQANFSFQANVEGAPPPAQAPGGQDNPLPRFTGDPDPVWGPCSTNPDIPSDQVHNSGYWQIGVDFGGNGNKDYVEQVQSTWSYTYPGGGAGQAEFMNDWGNPAPTQVGAGNLNTSQRRHYPDYNFTVQFRFKVRGYDQWITSAQVTRAAPRC